MGEDEILAEGPFEVYVVDLMTYEGSRTRVAFKSLQEALTFKDKWINCQPGTKVYLWHGRIDHLTASMVARLADLKRLPPGVAG